jgi:hypothetical protein
MNLRDLQKTLQENPNSFSRFVLPDGGLIPLHAHVTEVAYSVRNFIDCGGLTGRDEKVVLQTHVGNDTDHRLRSDRFARILELGKGVIPNGNLDVDVEYDCCVVSQYSIIETRSSGEYLDLILHRGRTRCRAHERNRKKENRGCDKSACC